MWILIEIYYQHSLFNWQNCFVKSGVVGTLLMDLSNAFDSLPHGLIKAKLHAHGAAYEYHRFLVYG